MNPIDRWLDECCERRAYANETFAGLFTSWRRYCERTGEHVCTEKRFSQELRRRGFKPKRQGGTGRAGFAGILLKCCEPFSGV